MACVGLGLAWAVVINLFTLPSVTAAGILSSFSGLEGGVGGGVTMELRDKAERTPTLFLPSLLKA